MSNIHLCYQKSKQLRKEKGWNVLVYAHQIDQEGKHLVNSGYFNAWSEILQVHIDVRLVAGESWKVFHQVGDYGEALEYLEGFSSAWDKAENKEELLEKWGFEHGVFAHARDGWENDFREMLLTRLTSLSPDDTLIAPFTRGDVALLQSCVFNENLPIEKRALVARLCTLSIFFHGSVVAWFEEIRHHKNPLIREGVLVGFHEALTWNDYTRRGRDNVRDFLSDEELEDKARALLLDIDNVSIDWSTLKKNTDEPDLE